MEGKPLDDKQIADIMLSLDKVYLPKSEWKKILSPELYEISRNKGTERPYTGQYNDFYKKGVYICSSCGLPLFSSKTKFDSRTGWPSFWHPINPKSLQLSVDYSFFMKRVEVLCNRCEAHLGHLFKDGPPPTGHRYCINSVTLHFVSEQTEPPLMPAQKPTELFSTPDE